MPHPTEVEFFSTDTALVSLHGEHDLGTRDNLVSALARGRAKHRLVVDLSACTFADSGALSLVWRAASDMASSGDSAVLVVPPNATRVRRALVVLGFDQLLTIRASRAEALTVATHRHRPSERTMVSDPGSGHSSA